MSTLAQKLLDIKKQRDTELGYKLKQLAPYVDAQYKNKLKEETEAYELQSGTDMIKQQAAGLGYKDFEPEGDTLQQREQSWNTFKINQSLSAESGAAGYVPPTDVGFYEKKAGLAEFKKDEQAKTTSEAKIATKQAGLDSKLKSLGTTYYKKAKERINSGEDAELVYADLKQIKTDSKGKTGGSAKEKAQATAYDKRFKALGLNKDLKNDTVYYKAKEKAEYGNEMEDVYYEIPVIYDDEKGWIVEATGDKVNPDYKWTKKPAKAEAKTGITPGYWTGKDGKKELRNEKMIIIPKGTKGKTYSQNDDLF